VEFRLSDIGSEGTINGVEYVLERDELAIRGVDLEGPWKMGRGNGDVAHGRLGSSLYEGSARQTVLVTADGRGVVHQVPYDSIRLQVGVKTRRTRMTRRAGRLRGHV